MTTRAIVSPEDQNVTFVELFFDLVFVFSVTQTVGILHHHFDWGGVGQAVLVFWLVWWAWTQFTWALNAADTTHTIVAFATLLATAIAFFMAVAVPYAFQGRAMWFAIPYVLVRVVGLELYGRVAAQNHPSQHAAVRAFAIVSLSGLGAVLAGAFAGGTAQYWLWGLAILLDVIAAMAVGRLEGWDLHPAHFAERHGLFVIIALGESLIVAASGVSSAEWTGSLVTLAVLAVTVTCAFWWSYFPRAKPALDRALEATTGPRQTTMARDTFSLLHFPMLCGVIAYAVALEEALAHPSTPMGLAPRLALAASVLLFVGGMGVASWRATGKPRATRLAITLVTSGAVLAARGVPPQVTLGIALAGVLAVAAAERDSPVPVA